MRNALLRYLRAVLNFAIRREWLSSNPVANIDFYQSSRKEVQTFSAKEVKKLLAEAQRTYPLLVPYLAIGIFAGVRPEEITRLDWSDIHDGSITVRPEVSKTNRRRFPDIAPNLASWLAPFQKSEGPVVTLSQDQLRKQRRALCKDTGVVWIQQGMRHSFCSNWLAIHEDVNRLVLQSGHDSVDTMWRRYHRGTRKEEAEKFWNIVPAKRPRGRKVIPFKAAA
jgi:integrase